MFSSPSCCSGRCCFTGSLTVRWRSATSTGRHTLGAAKVQSIERGKPADGVLQPGGSDSSTWGAGGERGTDGPEDLLARCAGAPVEGCRAAAPVQLTSVSGRDVHLRSTPATASRTANADRLRVRPVGKAFGALGAASAALSEMWHVTTETADRVRPGLTSSKARRQVSSIVGKPRTRTKPSWQARLRARVPRVHLAHPRGHQLFPFLLSDGGTICGRSPRRCAAGGSHDGDVSLQLGGDRAACCSLVFNGVSNDISRLGG